MTPDPTGLRRQLEPAVRPDYASGPARGPRPPIEHARFDELLERASRGLVESGRPVRYAVAAGEAPSPQQLERLAAAADLAEAAGARRALIVVEGRGLVLDVPQRVVAEELSAGTRLLSVDAAVYVAGDDEEPTPAPLPPPGAVAPRAVAEQVEAAHQRRAAG